VRFAWFLCLAACSFGARSAGTSQDGPAGGPRDAAADAAPDAFRFLDARPDAPPDACPDSDHDGICDDQDTWPCGAAPAALPTTVTMQTNGTKTTMVLTQIDAGGSGQALVAAPGTSITLTFHYAITDTACAMDCDDQIEIGWIPGHRMGCPFDNGVSRSNGATGDISTTITAPGSGGVYDLRSNIGQNYGCTYGGASDWWNAPPGSNWTLAYVCVH
jgi:hypothetical protein